MTMTFGGKSADEALTEHMMKQHQEQFGFVKPKDPLVHFKKLRSNHSKRELLSTLGDYTLWIEQFLQEMSALARKEWRLTQMLKDPDRSKGKARALRRREDMQEQLAQYAVDIATLEAWCDRYWRALPRSVRAHYGMDWNADPTERRLIGKAWTYKAKQFKWPDSFIITEGYFRSLPPQLLHDLKTIGIPAEGVRLGKVFEWDLPEEGTSDHRDHRAYSYHGQESRYAKWYSALSVPDEAREPNAISLAGRTKEGSEESG